MKNNREFTVISVMEDSGIVVISSHEELIECGTFAKVYTKGNKLIDPDTGEDLGYAELYKGTGIVIQSDKQYAMIRCIKKKIITLNNIFLQSFFSPQFEFIGGKKPLAKDVFKEDVFKEDVFKIDSNKYVEAKFNNPVKGDKVKLINNY